MNTNLAHDIVGLVTDENDRFYFVQKDGQTYALDKSEGEHALGESVKGFAYTDMKQRLRLTTLEVNKKDRIWGVLAYQEDFQRIARPAYNNMQNQNWPAIVYRLKLSGTFVYLPENNMLGFIHPSERYAEPRLGQVLDARVIGFREVDRTLNLSLKPRSFEMLENDAQMILAYLENNGGFMTLNDKSSPEEIKATFGISKGQFKKALGGLMKAGKITQDAFGTELK